MSLGFAPSFLARTASRRRSARAKQLIAIFQRGAVDGLSVVVPFGEAEYYRARPSIAIARPGSSRRRGDRSRWVLRLQPAAAAAEAVLGHRAQLAVVHACGSPDATRSHFDAQDYMETATPGVKSTRRRLAEPLSAGAAEQLDGARRRRSAPWR